MLSFLMTMHHKTIRAGRCRGINEERRLDRGRALAEKTHNSGEFSSTARRLRVLSSSAASAVRCLTHHSRLPLKSDVRSTQGSIRIGHSFASR